MDHLDINTSLAQAQTQIHIHANYFSLPPRLEEKTKANGAAKTISPIKGDRRQLEAKGSGSQKLLRYSEMCQWRSGAE